MFGSPIQVEFVLQVLAALCLVPPLIRGAINDVNIRSFPKEYWKGYSGVGFILALVYYFICVYVGDYTSVIIWIFVAFVCCIAFYFMGMRYGSGGDWRALMYIAAITPWLIPATLILSMIAAVVQSAYGLWAHFNSDRVMFITIPWALGICAAFVCAAGLWIATNSFIFS